MECILVGNSEPLLGTKHSFVNSWEYCLLKVQKLVPAGNCPGQGHCFIEDCTPSLGTAHIQGVVNAVKRETTGPNRVNLCYMSANQGLKKCSFNLSQVCDL